MLITHITSSVMYPHLLLRIWLDVDDLRNFETLIPTVRRSRNVLVLITKGYFDSYWCRKEIETAVEAKKNIILVHDVTRCEFPNVTALPEAVQAAFNELAVPFQRPKAFRLVAMQEIARRMGLPV